MWALVYDVLVGAAVAVAILLLWAAIAAPVGVVIGRVIRNRDRRG